MIWQNPWAWLGLLAVAVPVLIHLLGRRSARAQRFPSLRFIESSPLMATRRTRLTDIPLLLVRMAIIAAAVAALALPLVVTADRERDLGRTLARAIIVDTSASVRDDVSPGSAISGGSATGALQPGARAIEIPRREAAARAAEAQASVVLETRAPALALAGAVAWLERQPGRREIVVISDFQAGSIDSTDLALVPREVGIALVQLSTRAPSAYEAVIRRRDEEIVARASRVVDSAGGAPTTRDAIGVEWTVRPALSARDVDDTIILAGDDERPRAEAALRAAVAGGVPAVSVSHPVAVVYPGYEDRERLLRDARPPDAAWQGNLVVRLAADPMLGAAAATASIMAGPPDSVLARDPLRPPFVALARTRRGEPVIVAAAGSVDGRDRLLIFVRADAGSLASAAALAAIERLAVPEAPVAELEPTRVPESTLSAWRRPAAAASSSRTLDDDGASDGRWLWMLALILIGAETWMRRHQREVKAAEVVRERAA